MDNKKTNNRLLAGIFLFILGVLLFAGNFGFINTNILGYIFRWQTILIFIGIFAIVRKPRKLAGYILIFSGTIFYIPVLFGVSIYLIVWPAMITGVGIMILFRGFLSRRFPHCKQSFVNCSGNDFEIKISKREN